MIIGSIAKAIEKSGKSRYQIAKETGVDEAVLYRIVKAGRCGIKTADILCKYFKLELVSKKRRKGRKSESIPDEIRLLIEEAMISDG
jgi:ribosome-binding protein aMBF1 (putative translation factor)